MGGTLEGTGTTPPAVTITTSSSLVSRTEGVLVDMQAGGARGTATFTVSINNGTTLVEESPGDTTFLTAATVAIPGTDLTLNFAVGTYNANNVYRAVCNPWLDKVGAYPSSTNNYANSTQPTRPYIITLGSLGAPCIRFDGVDDQLTCTGTLGTSAFAGADHASFVMTLADIVGNTAAAHSMHSVSNTTDTDLPLYEMGFSGTTNLWTTQRRSDTGVATGTNSVVLMGTGQALIEDAFDGTNRRLTINGADVIGGDSGVAADQSGKTITTTQSVLGCRHTQSGRSQFSNFDLYERFYFDVRPSDADIAGLRAYLLS